MFPYSVLAILRAPSHLGRTGRSLLALIDPVAMREERAKINSSGASFSTGQLYVRGCARPSVVRESCRSREPRTQRSTGLRTHASGGGSNPFLHNPLCSRHSCYRVRANSSQYALNLASNPLGLASCLTWPRKRRWSAEAERWSHLRPCRLAKWLRDGIDVDSKVASKRNAGYLSRPWPEPLFAR
jgi:hypothetical protein